MTGSLVPQGELVPAEQEARAARFPVGATIEFEDLTEHARLDALGRLRAAEPVSWVPALGGWLVTSWELARSVLGRRDEFSVWAEPNLVRASLGVMMLTSQGDAHTRQRAPFDAPFRMRAVRDTFAEPIAACTDALLAALRPAGECELGAAFAGPFAVEVAADVLGLGLADVGRIMAFYQAFAGAMVYDGDPRAAAPGRRGASRAERAPPRRAGAGAGGAGRLDHLGGREHPGRPRRRRDRRAAARRPVRWDRDDRVAGRELDGPAAAASRPAGAGARAARPAAERARGVDAARHAGGVHGALDDDAVHRDRRRDARPRRVRRRSRRWRRAATRRCSPIRRGST